jgi:hypothetical protein
VLFFTVICANAQCAEWPAKTRHAEMKNSAAVSRHQRATPPYNEQRREESFMRHLTDGV